MNLSKRSELIGIDWVKAIQNQEKRAIARFITHIENESNQTQLILEQIYPLTGRAFVVGVTGPPGAGKSTLVDGLIAYLRSLDLTVAVVAIDPSSPFTGGAILGDRVRMTNHALDNGVFIRSMGTRGTLGGMARHTTEVIHVLDAAGYDVILVETVGVGQAELAVMNSVDSVTVVLHPESGDMVQVLKAGIMEIGDFFVINKADLKGADRLADQIRDMTNLVKKTTEWHPPIKKLIAKDKQGIEGLWEGLRSHQLYVKNNGDLVKRRSACLRYEVREILREFIHQHIEKIIEDESFKVDIHNVVDRKSSPYAVARKWSQQLFGG